MLPMKNKGPKACTTCAKAKARCISGPEGALKCERCHRLNKLCVLQTPAPPRTKRTPKLSKIAALEKRLEELSSQVGEQHQHQQGSSPSETPSPAPASEAVKSVTAGHEYLGFNHIFPTKPSAVSSAASVPVYDQTSRQEESSGDGKTDVEGARKKSDEAAWPSPSEEEAIMEQYRAVHAEMFPFVVVPANMSIAELKRDHTYLWKAIKMVTCFLDSGRQVQLGEELLEDISREAFVEGSKSLDLLQALQLLVAWYNYALKGTQLTNILFLARGMCVNLGLKDGELLSQGVMTESLDHMRLYAGTYYLNTLVFTANKRPDILMNTTYLETCCKVIEARMEVPSDAYLVQLVRVQQLAQAISLTMAPENLAQHATRIVPLMMVIQPFQDQLNAFSSTLPSHPIENPTLRSHVLIAEILLYEIALSDRASAATFLSLSERIQLLWSCLRSLKEFFAIRFSNREMERPRFLCVHASDFVFTIITGMKLMTLQLPGWNLARVHPELAMCDIMDDQIRDLVFIIQRRETGVVQTGREDPFSRLMRQLKTLRDLSKMEIERLGRSSVASNVGDAMAMSGVVAGDNTPNGPNMATMLSGGMSQETGFGEMDVEFWQSVGMDNVWSVIGDPSSILGTSM